MTAQINLTIIAGKLTGQTFNFSDRSVCIIGRANDCDPQLPDDQDHSTISRYHCLLDINPPHITIRDFGSKNGTFVNNNKIGQRESHQTPEEGTKIKFPEYQLQDQDEIKLGDTIFKVNIINTPTHSNTIKFYPQTVVSKKFNFWEFIQGLLQRANQGEQNLKSIRGYELIRLLGTGGFSEVYLAKHQNTGQEVAIKILSPEHSDNETMINLFLREIENTKALKHPHIVEIRDFGYADETFFLTMEYCNQGNILDLIEKRGKLFTSQEAIPIIIQVLAGLEYAHNAEIPFVKKADGTIGKGRGLVHRDIKPANIFLHEINGQIIPKIGDYGLAKAFDLAGLSGQTLTGQKAGTPNFVCRKQVVNFKYAQPEVDIWACAATLYTMLTGYAPRDFSSDKDPFSIVLNTKPVPILQRGVNMPLELA
ncbi:MAG TPA: protein kinase, partial [Allocoleopsis sp.]